MRLVSNELCHLRVLLLMVFFCRISSFINWYPFAKIATDFCFRSTQSSQRMQSRDCPGKIGVAAVTAGTMQFFLPSVQSYRHTLNLYLPYHHRAWSYQCCDGHEKCSDGAKSNFAHWRLGRDGPQGNLQIYSTILIFALIVRSIDWLLDLMDGLLDLSMDWLMNYWFHLRIDWLIGSIDWSIDWLSDWLVGCSVDWLDWLIDWLVDWFWPLSNSNCMFCRDEARCRTLTNCRCSVLYVKRAIPFLGQFFLFE